MPLIIILGLGGFGLLLIDHQVSKEFDSRVEVELEWLAKSALESLILSDKTLSITHIAKRLGDASGARITFVDAKGVVTGDSQVASDRLATIPNHINRPEFIQAKKSGLGTSRRHSETTRQHLIYTAVYKNININGNDIGYYSRASFSTSVIDEEILQIRFALLSILTLDVIVLAILILISLRWLSLSIKKDQNVLEDIISARDHEIKLMHELDSLLSTCGELSEAKDVIEKILPNILVDSHGAISIHKASRDKLSTKIFWGASWPEKLIFTPKECWALRKGHSHLFNPATTGVACEHYSISTNKSMLCVPLVAHGETIGVMHVANLNLTDKAIKLANAIAKRIGIAIANIELRYDLRQQAIKDTLTNLYNRRYLFEALEQLVARAIRNKEQIGIIMVDIDHFKRINDTYGHDAGDIVLKELSLFFRQMTRVSDIVCRYGGEEFCIVCPESTLEETLFIAEKLCFALRQLSIKLSANENISVTLSAGVGIFSHDNKSIEATISEADNALYQAKAAGRNCVNCA